MDEELIPLHKGVTPSRIDSDEREGLITDQAEAEENDLSEDLAGLASQTSDRARLARVSPPASSPRVHLHGVTTDSSPDTGPDSPPVEVPSVEEPVMAEEDPNGEAMEMTEEGQEDEPNGRPSKLALMHATQGGVVEISSLIVNPGIKRAESMELINASLHQLARDGDVETMRRLLESLTGNVKRKVNAHDDEDLSALHYGARYNHVPIVQLLIEAGASPNDVDDDGGTPLHFAARYKRMRLGTQSPTGETPTEAEDGEEEKTQDVVDGVSQGFDATPQNSVILCLVSHGANVNAQDIYGCTPLHFAAMRGNEVAAKEILSCKETSIETVDKQSMTALHLAASHEEAEIVRMLIEKGANLQCEDEERGLPLHFACMQGSLEVANMLFEAAEQLDGWVTVSQMVSAQDNQDNTPLHLAVENRSLDVAKLCIDKGADVNTTRNNYMTPLHLAAVSGELSIVQLLIEHNARVDALDIMQQTPLHSAAEYDHDDVVEYLLEKGAKINRHDKDNYSPLLLAAVEGNHKTLATLLRRGANLYDVDKSDKTALFLCAEQDQLEALKVLLSHPKAKDLLDVSDRYDNTPLHVAAKNGYLNIVKALLDSGADLEFKNEEDRTPIHNAAMDGKTAVVRELVKRNNTVVNHEDEDSNTALHLAALAGHNKVVKELIEAGADIEARNTTLWTPLDCAAAKGWPKVVRTLLEADAPVDPMDKSKTTPLHLAAGRGHVAVVNILLDWNANVRLNDTDGNNCLDRAIDGGHKEVVIAIINSSHWRAALMNETIDLATGLRQTPMRKLIRKMPDAAERVFSHCTTSEISNPDHPDYSINFNYEFLDDMYANWRDDGMSDTLSVSESIYDDEYHLLPTTKPYSNDATVLKKNHPLSIMVATNQEDLLAHPLVTSLLRHKWSGFGRYFYYVNLTLFIIFLTFLTGYILVSTPPYCYTNSTAPKQRCMRDLPVGRTSYSAAEWIFVRIGKYIILGLAAFEILREIFQIYNAKLNYLGWENLIEWVLNILAILFVLDFNTYQQETSIRLDWQWQIGAVAIFLAWIDFVLFIRKLPRFGIYVVMFTDVFMSFVSFFPVFFIFIFAFAISFYALFQNQFELQSLGHSLIKTTVMMIGEFDFASLFLGFEDNPSDHDHEVYYKFISYLLFVFFIIIMSIIVMNLLVGLAVDDIKGVQEQAVLKRLAMQVELVLDVESLLPQWLRRKFIRKCQVIYPNRRRGCWAKCPKFEPSSLSSSAINKALNPELPHDVCGRAYELVPLPGESRPNHSVYEMVQVHSETDEIEQLQANQDKMMENINNLRFRVKTLSQQSETLTSMMTALLRHQQIDWQDEDFQQEEG